MFYHKLEDEFVKMVMGLHPDVFEGTKIDNELKVDQDSIVFSSDPSVKSTHFIIPRKLKELASQEIPSFDELSDVDLSQIGFGGFIQTQKFVDFKNNQIV